MGFRPGKTDFSNRLPHFFFKALAFVHDVYLWWNFNKNKNRHAVNNSPLLLVVLLLSATLSTLRAQVNYTANDTVPPYHGKFHFGANLGAYYFWTDQQLADIAAGNPALGVKGVGVNCLRLSLPESFLDFWGYDIRLDAFHHYDTLGITDNVVFVGYPAAHHKDPTYYCPNGPSELFANMYLPIWDNGENGTPVNDLNYYALYMYQLVSRYHPYVRHWEIWNEPDFDFVGDSSKQPGEAGNWWEHDPDPCHFALHAPAQHYVRLLRISYEVIKSVAPEDYVAIGGIGYPSFLDVVLRNTDNPNGGQVDTLLYPKTGGAYFDVLSYHSYPHIDNSLRIWSDEIMGFQYFRHSDRCVDGMLDRKARMQDILAKYNYDGITYPAKRWIITESNIPRVEVDEYLGSPEAQRNYLVKAVVAAQMNGIDQLHVYQLGDIEPEKTALSEFHLMGLYSELDSVPKYLQKPTTAGIAFGTASQMLLGKTFDANQTAKMQLPDNVRGGAFREGTSGNFTYVLWAKTETDRSEDASAIYSFPSSFNIQRLNMRTWDFSEVGITTLVDASQVELSGEPIFLRDSKSEQVSPNTKSISLHCNPNPFQDALDITLSLPDAITASMSLYDVQGRLVRRFFGSLKLAEGDHYLPVDGTNLAPGVYIVDFHATDGRRVVCKVVKV